MQVNASATDLKVCYAFIVLEKVESRRWAISCGEEGPCCCKSRV